jgi:hypothetical protein
MAYFLPPDVPALYKKSEFQEKGTMNAKVDLSFFPAGMEIMFEKLAELPPGASDMKRITGICNSYGVRFI